MDTDKDAAPARPRKKRRWRPETLIPTLAVVVVTVTAVVTAVMVARTDAPAAARMAAASEAQKKVVQAPPLKAAPMPPAQTATSALGAGPACRNCGVVEMVVAVYAYGQPQPSGYQMHIRMDDGSTRTVEQRGALAAGSRVLMEGRSIRPLPAAPGPG